MTALFEPDVNHLLAWGVPRSSLRDRYWEVLDVMVSVREWGDTPAWIVDALRAVPDRPKRFEHLLGVGSAHEHR